MFPPSGGAFSITCHSAQLLAPAHTRTCAFDPGVSASQQRAGSSIPTAVPHRLRSHGGPYYRHQSCRGNYNFRTSAAEELWSALIEYSRYFLPGPRPRSPYWARRILRQTNLEGRGKAIKEKGRGAAFEPLTVSPLFASVSLDVRTKGRTDPKSQRHSSPAPHAGCQLQSTADSRAHRAPRFLFSFRRFCFVAGLTARSLRIRLPAAFPLSRGKWVSGNKRGSEQQLHIKRAARLALRRKTSPLRARGTNRQSFCFFRTHT